MARGKNEQKEVARNNVAGFSGWPKPGWQKMLQRRLWLCPVLYWARCGKSVLGKFPAQCLGFESI